MFSFRGVWDDERVGLGLIRARVHRSARLARRPLAIDMQNTNALQKLMVAGLDDERMLRHESEFVGVERRSVLTRLADDREANVEQLRATCAASGLVEGTGSWAELFRELARSLWVAACGRHSGDSVSACRRSMGRAESLYDRAVALPWPKETRALLLEQRVRVHHGRDELMAIQF